MQTTPKFLKKEPRHIQASAGSVFYAEITAFILSFFCEFGHCGDFLESRPDFAQFFIIDHDAKKVKIWRWSKIPLDSRFARGAWLIKISQVSPFAPAYFMKIQKLTYHRNFWPRVTSGDLTTTFFGKLTSKAFWYLNSLPSQKLEI